MAFIRAYRPSDHEELLHVFDVTASPDLVAGGPSILHLASYNWFRPYPVLSPEFCFVADDGAGHAVGYIIGTPSTPEFVRMYRERYMPHIQSGGLSAPGPDENCEWSENLPNALKRITFNPESMLQRGIPGFVHKYPAHFHIDLLPEWQRVGLGRKLMDTFLASVEGAGAKGVYCGMVATNVDAGKFYAKLGFEPYELKGEEEKVATVVLQTKSL